MATQYVTLSGTAKWAKVRKYDDAFGQKQTSIDLYLDEDQWPIYDASGMTMKPKETEEGRYIKFRRPEKKLIGDEVVTFGFPEVEYEGKPFEGLIGNGSKVTVHLVVYDTVKGKGHRLNKVVINSLVEYKPNTNSINTTTPPSQQDVAIATAGKKRPF